MGIVTPTTDMERMQLQYSLELEKRIAELERRATDARMALDMLVYRLREDGPAMTRDVIKARVAVAAGFLNRVVPRSPLRDEAK